MCSASAVVCSPPSSMPCAATVPKVDSDDDELWARDTDTLRELDHELHNTEVRTAGETVTWPTSQWWGARGG
jgi:hypothetical protein